MKNKLKQTMTALCAALIFMGGFSVPAYAQGTAAEPPTEDATNDSNVVVEEPETPPLTPKGNATLVDDFGGNKQLITVTTKGGNYFYILIDRAAEGEQTVHFLNQVDEADLLALMEDGSTEAAPPAVCTDRNRGSHEKAGSLQLYGKMRSRKGKYVLPGMCNYSDRLHRQGTHANTHRAAGRTQRKRRQSRRGACLSPLCAAWWRRGVLLL